MDGTRLMDGGIAFWITQDEQVRACWPVIRSTNS